MMSKIQRKIRVENKMLRIFIAELVSTFVLLVIGLGAVANFRLYKNVPSITVGLAFGLGITIAIIIAGNISGANVNPAVSLAFLLTGKITIGQFFVYMAGQSVGAFLSSVVVYLLYLDEINSTYDQTDAITGLRANAGIWATYPSKNVTTVTSFWDQVFGTFLLILVVLSLTDKRNGAKSMDSIALFSGLTVVAISFAFGPNTGGAINPVRDFIPRVFTSMVGYGKVVFTANDYFFWIPLFAPFIGATLASIAYSLLIRNNWPPVQGEEEERDQNIIMSEIVTAK